VAKQAQIDSLVDWIVERVGHRIVVGLPLGLGKPNRLINALYRRALKDPQIELEIVTALSLDIPQPRHWLEQRLMEPIVERLFGADYPRLAYLVDLKNNALPGNVRVTEFYFQSGAALGNPAMQRHYVSSNYTHVARDLVDRGVNLVMQLVARDDRGRLSLSCNPDVTLDLVERVRNRADYPLCSLAQVHPGLPFMHGDAVVEADYFDAVVDFDPDQPLFALPRQPISPQDYAVGFHAGRLIADEEAESLHDSRIERIGLWHGPPPEPGLERGEGDGDGRPVGGRLKQVAIGDAARARGSVRVEGIALPIPADAHLQAGVGAPVRLQRALHGGKSAALRQRNGSLKGGEIRAGVQLALRLPPHHHVIDGGKRRHVRLIRKIKKELHGEGVVGEEGEAPCTAAPMWSARAAPAAAHPARRWCCSNARRRG